MAVSWFLDGRGLGEVGTSIAIRVCMWGHGATSSSVLHDKGVDDEREEWGTVANKSNQRGGGAFKSHTAKRVSHTSTCS